MVSEDRSKPTRKVLIVDDHPLFRMGLVEVLSSSKDLVVCGHVGEASSAMRIVESEKPSLVIIDISLGNGSGLELIKQIRAIDSEAKLLVCSMHDERLFAERAIRAGANGYLGKDEPPEAMLSAMEQVLNGKLHLSEKIAERLLIRRIRGGEKSLEHPAEILSDREFEVFNLISQGFSTRRIARHLHVSVKTVETHREHIKAKLGYEDSAELVQQAILWRMKDASIDQVMSGDEGATGAV